MWHPDPGHVDPPLQESGPLVVLERGVAQAGADHAVGDRVELGHRGADGGGQVLFALLVALRPDAAQAVVRDHLLEQVLRATKRKIFILLTCFCFFLTTTK